MMVKTHCALETSSHRTTRTATPAMKARPAGDTAA
jgi:hypothetical protein